MKDRLDEWCEWCAKKSEKGEKVDTETVRQKFQETIDWMKSVAKEEMKTVEGCRWLEQNWNIHVEYPPGTPDEQKFFKPPPATKSDVE